MTDFAFLRDCLLATLKEQGIPALLSLPPEGRRRFAAPFVLLGIKELTTEGAGFANYLGEHFDEDTKRQEERYGLQTEVCFSLDLYGASEMGGGLFDALRDRLAEAMAREAPAGLRLKSLRFGQSLFDQSCGLLRAEGEARLSGLLYATRSCDGSQITFDVRGGITLE